MDQKLNVVFAGTPEFAIPPLEALLSGPYNVSAVYTQPDRPAGRGRKPRPGPVKQRALEAGVPVMQPTTLRDADAQAELAAFGADVMVVVAYGLILPEPVLTTPRLGCVNIHASLLPRWRGAAPIQRAILAGDSETGVAIMKMDKGLDTGAVLAEDRCPIGDDDTAGDLHDRLAELGARLLADTLPKLAAGAVTPREQPEQGVTYADKLSKDEAWIDWNRPAPELVRQVRAFNPWPVAQTRLADAPLRIWAAEAIADASGAPGEVVAASRDGIDVATGNGGLRLLRIQAAGGKPVAARDFLNGRSLSVGDRLG